MENVKLAGVTVPSLVSSELIESTTSVAGAASKITLKVSVPPPSAVARDKGLYVNPATSSSLKELTPTALPIVAFALGVLRVTETGKSACTITSPSVVTSIGWVKVVVPAAKVKIFRSHSGFRH